MDKLLSINGYYFVTLGLKNRLFFTFGNQTSNPILALSVLEISAMYYHLMKVPKLNCKE